MQYIECIHCGKRYAATPKHLRAMGKSKVRCKNCGKSFPVVVYEARDTTKAVSDDDDTKRDDTA